MKTTCENINVPIVIPAYEPDERLVTLCVELAQNSLTNVIIVDDGSGEGYDDIFDRAVSVLSRGEGKKPVLLKSAVNQGKGRALKTAFNEILLHYPEAVGCVSADSDGQHSPEDIKCMIDELCSHPGCLILGSRDFDDPGVPFKSRFGNKLTRKVMRFTCGISLNDTQTGLRAIPKSFLSALINVPGERFEYETQMLIAAKDRLSFRERRVRTIYDSKTNHKTHFDTVRDSIRIYRIFFSTFFRFLLSSLSVCVLDLALFFILSGAFAETSLPKLWYIPLSVVIARVISAAYNYLVNYHLVFRSSSSRASSAFGYFLLAVTIMCLSALFTLLGVTLLPFVNETLIKAAADSVLFLLSYYVQQNYIFRGKNRDDKKTLTDYITRYDPERKCVVKIWNGGRKEYVLK